MAAIYPPFEGAEGLVPHISAWHGFNDASLLMTIGVVVVGCIAVLIPPLLARLYTIAPMRWNLDSLYNGMLMQIGERFDLS